MEGWAEVVIEDNKAAVTLAPLGPYERKVCSMLPMAVGFKFCSASSHLYVTIMVQGKYYKLAQKATIKG